ncbi:2-phospho-L-lactate guanylyltransferase [Herbidospora mongoliensis]|uniref:2-phospho-L-lactate guanylyltransferase n=1 Tax=Herbidospora mongoliensis TaxID=688067 RepID=UPI000A07825A|nr:2-phospho-L-lactate guanylyltransferase [Herbidospora mongoliensis]
MQGLGWTMVIPVKTLIRAKTRLAAAVGPHREDLAVAVAADTVTAALATAGVGRVIVVTADPRPAEVVAGLGAEVVHDPDVGLNAALRAGAAHAAGAVAALQADLPALRPRELARVLAAAAEFDQAFLPDAADVGTVLYAVRPGIPFRPRFGGESRARHLTGGAKELCLDDVDSVRRDVDTIEDLRAAAALGLGPHTAAVARLVL